MLSEEVKEALAERLTYRIEQVNTYILREIAKKIDEIGKVSPTNAYQLANMLKYGADFNKIIEELKKTNVLNEKDIDKIFDEVAKTNYLNSKELYLIKNKGFIPYQDNINLVNQVNALKRLTKETYRNLSNTSVIGFSAKDRDGNVIFRTVTDMYRNVIDEAVLSVYQGKGTFDKEARRIIKGLALSGLMSVDYESGKSMRLDSAVRMNIQGAIRDLENDMQLVIGEQTDCDGIEITVHEYPAPDHEPIQGHQFYNEEFRKLQDGEDFEDIDGNQFEGIRRGIGDWNCYHNIFSITVGISKPMYSEKELQEIIDRNHTPIEIDGKEYTKYQCSQLQRKLETEIRKQKDIQIMARENPDMKDLVYQSQRNIEALKNKYIEITKKAGLKTRVERMKVSGYRYIREPKAVKINLPVEPATPKGGGMVAQVQSGLGFNEVVQELKKKNVTTLGLDRLDERMMTESLNEVNDVLKDYPALRRAFKDKGYTILDGDLGSSTYMSAGISKTTFNRKKYKKGGYEDLKKEYQRDMELGSDGSIGWHYKVNDGDEIKSIISHELGHTIEFRYIRDVRHKTFNNLVKEEDKIIMNSIYFRAMQDSGLGKSELRKKYLTEYAKSKRNYEAFAEIFSGMRNGVDNPLTRAMKEWLDEFYE